MGNSNIHTHYLPALINVQTMLYTDVMIEDLTMYVCVCIADVDTDELEVQGENEEEETIEFLLKVEEFNDVEE